MAPVLETSIPAKRPEKGLLEGILGRLPPDQAGQMREDLVAVFLVEVLESGNDTGCNIIICNGGQRRNVR